MKNINCSIIALLFCLAASSTIDPPSVTGQDTVDSSQPRVVKLVQTDGSWQLLRDGKPYTVRGAGGDGSLKALSAAGANSNRTWGVGDETRARLDEADKNGLSVAVGIWLEHERHGKMDYENEEHLNQQTELTLKHVRDLKDHPAVLVWGIGNEMEGDGSNPAVWAHIETLAQRVKQEDPNHPVMTVIAEMGDDKIKSIHQLCPSVDIIGINSYGGSQSLPKRYHEQGGTKPYIVTEFGPVGTWEVPKNSFDAIVEPTSTAKAEMYRAAHEAFSADSKHCLGSYAFLWGNKQEGTATWFGMLLPDGKKTAAADVMSQLWTGKPPKNRCPEVKSFVIEGSPKVDAGDSVKVRLIVADPENDIPEIRWVLLAEADAYITGGDFQKTPEEISDAILSSEVVAPAGPTTGNSGESTVATIKMPTKAGIYRIYAYAEDSEHQNAATANLPIFVKPGPLKQPGAKVELPLTIYDETVQVADGGTHPSPAYVPSGYMGSTEAIEVDQQCSIAPQQGPTCLRITYRKSSNWGGVAWQHPADDWGKKPGGFDLTGAKKLSFWAKGKNGGEKITFGFGMIKSDQPFFDTAKSEISVSLTKDWKEYSISCGSKDLRRIKSGFYCSFPSPGEPVEIFLDRIVYR